ncbi:efflux RND transporter periplasmic adaptor subunit [Roseateles albus]|uniref:HlyD family efflux transporter periplasmic adaptor subunit n=1 Tax=Roseateles albus TaxID=2987525 RepID=A0ABT5KBQ0_9BURK|nr:HlyD family efflux transporter periplasmic adaptor subunit [Roseateles albus]MDC8771366.1 HlyD family efflux transporter periplasmic adaptor subunit [Roseateles albus]
MDIRRSPHRFAFLRRPIVKWSGLAAAGLALLGGALSLGLNARPASMSVSAKTVSLATVERGALDLDLRASGILLPSEVRWIAAQSEGRVERIAVQAGAELAQGQVLLVLSNPQLQQRAEESRWTLEQAQAEARALRLSLESQQMSASAAIQRAELALQSAQLQWAADQELLKDGMVSKLAYQRSEFNLKQSTQGLSLERQLFQQAQANQQAQLSAKQATLAKLSKSLQRDLDQVAALTVRAPMSGILQELNLQPGQSVSAGANLAKMARADALYAELQVQEAMARDIAIGQTVRLDLRTGGSDGQIAGLVARIAPKVSKGSVQVDISLQGPLPRGARPDLSVDGTIAITRLADTLQVQRPVFSQAQSTASVFRIGTGGVAERVPVQFGAASVGRIAVLSGLSQGDRIVVSDTSAWSQAARVSIR